MRAISRAIIVLPVPGFPEKIICSDSSACGRPFRARMRLTAIQLTSPRTCSLTEARPMYPSSSLSRSSKRSVGCSSPPACGALFAGASRLALCRLCAWRAPEIVVYAAHIHFCHRLDVFFLKLPKLPAGVFPLWSLPIAPGCAADEKKSPARRPELLFFEHCARMRAGGFPSAKHLRHSRDTLGHFQLARARVHAPVALALFHEIL